MLICCRYERLLTSVNLLIRWNQATFMPPSGTRLDDLLLTSWHGSQSHMRRIFLILSSTQSSSIHAWRPKVGLFIISVFPKRYPAWTPVNCPGMSTYKQTIVCCVKVPKVLQLLCPFLRAKTAISYEPLVVGEGGWSSKSLSPNSHSELVPR